MSQEQIQEQLEGILEEPRQFWRDSVRFINKCSKPDQKEYLKICQAVGVGFLLMGFVGFFVKLVHIPINNIIV